MAVNDGIVSNGRYFWPGGVVCIFLAVSLAIGKAGSNSTSLLTVLLCGLSLVLSASYAKKQFFRMRLSAVILEVFFFISLILIAIYQVIQGDSAANSFPSSTIHEYYRSDKSSGLIEILKILGLSCIAGSGFCIGHSKRIADRVLLTLLFISVIYAAFSLAVYSFWPQNTIFAGAKLSFLGRLTGNFTSPNSAATFFGCTIIGSLCWSFERLEGRGYYSAERGRLEQNINLYVGLLPALFIPFAALIATSSRSGFVATLAGSLIVLSLEVRRIGGRHTFRKFLLLVGVVLFFVALGAGRLTARFSILDRDAYERFALLKNHERFIEHAGFTGFGLGNFSQINKFILTPENYNALYSVRSLHNVYLQWVEEAGWVGTLLMFLCIGLPIFLTISKLLKIASLGRRTSLLLVLLS